MGKKIKIFLLCSFLSSFLFSEDLSKYKKSLYSQNGEDGIIAKIFQEIPPTLKFCLEFHGNDGINASNTYLLRRQGWKSLTLTQKSQLPKEDVYRETLAAENVNQLLDKYIVPYMIDLLSFVEIPHVTDIWRAIDERYQPAAVIITNCFSDIADLYYLGRSKGYSLVYSDKAFFLFVQEKLLKGKCTFKAENPIPKSPFAIDFIPKKNLQSQDYIDIQQEIQTIDIKSTLFSLYPNDQGYTTFEDFYSRCSRGLRQKMIDPERGLFPIQKLVKIGHGGDNCIVCCAPYDGNRSQLIDSLTKELVNTGFNGYFLTLIGGFPNPTGREIQYVAVPYSFKIFMMLEAYYLGFNKVIWIDTACFPLQDPTPLFSYLETTGSLLTGWQSFPWAWRYILPSTHEVLKNVTGTDVLNVPYVCTRVFGLKMNTDMAKKLIREYYSLVEIGTPFLSCYPEEFAITALLGKPDFSSWQLYPYAILRGADNEEPDSQEIINQRRAEGYFFYHVKH